MDLSIIIVNWNSAAYCADCLASIYASNIRVSFEVIVIDNASYDGCDRMLESFFPEVRYIQGRNNAGFARANNQAFTGSTGEKLCFLNPDTKIRGAALQTLYDSLEKIPTAGAVGALLFNGDGTLQTSCVLPFPTVLNQAFDMEWLRKRFPLAKLFGARAIFSKIKGPQAVEAVSGACIMMFRKTFIDIGMFSPEYFMYAEDIDLCHKIRMTGKKVFLINEAEITHFGGGSSKDQKIFFGAILLRESNYRLLRKFRGYGYALLYRISLGGMGMIRIAGLLLCLAPATVTGHGHSVFMILKRWWQLLKWSVGFNQIPVTNIQAASPLKIPGNTLA